MTTTPTPGDLGRLKTAAWRAVRRAGETGEAADFEASMATMLEVQEAEEAYRLAHAPNALKVFAVCDHEIGQTLSIYAVFATGPECIFEAPCGPVCDCGRVPMPLGAITVCLDDVEHSDTACIDCPAVTA